MAYFEKLSVLLFLVCVLSVVHCRSVNNASPIVPAIINADNDKYIDSEVTTTNPLVEKSTETVIIPYPPSLAGPVIETQVLFSAPSFCPPGQKYASGRCRVIA